MQKIGVFFSGNVVGWQQRKAKIVRLYSHGWRNRRGVGNNVPPLLGPAGYKKVQGGGPMKMIFASTAQSLFSTVQVTYISAFCLNAEMYVRPAHFPKESLWKNSLWCNLRHKIPVQTISGWSPRYFTRFCQWC